MAEGCDSCLNESIVAMDRWPMRDCASKPLSRAAEIQNGRVGTGPPRFLPPRVNLPVVTWAARRPGHRSFPKARRPPRANSSTAGSSRVTFFFPRVPQNRYRTFRSFAMARHCGAPIIIAFSSSSRAS